MYPDILKFFGIFYVSRFPKNGTIRYFHLSIPNRPRILPENQPTTKNFRGSDDVDSNPVFDPVPDRSYGPSKLIFF